MAQPTLNNPWLGMNADDELTGSVTQQSLNQLSAPLAKQPTLVTTGQPVSEYTSYMDNPEIRSIAEQMAANRQTAVDQQTAGIQNYEQRLKDHLARNSSPQVDLTPLLALTDTWTGSKFANSYKRPTDSKGIMETTAALQQGLQKARGALTDDEQSYLLSSLGLYQKADDARLKAMAKDSALSTQKSVAEMKTKAAQEKGGGLDLTPGQKKFDITAAGELEDWTSGGEASADKNLKRLRESMAELATAGDDGSISGRVIGNLPDIARPERSLKIQQDVQGAALGALKATLGAAFTEKEGQRIMSIAYDPRLSPAENVKKIEAAIAELEVSKLNKNAKKEEFMSKGTLKDYRGPKASAPRPAYDKDVLDYSKTHGISPDEALAIKKQRGG